MQTTMVQKKQDGRKTRWKRGAAQQKGGALNPKDISADNPFKIEKAILTGGRGLGASPEAHYLAEAMKALPVDNRTAAAIPITVAPSQREAENLFLNAKRIVAAEHKDAAFTKRVVKDAKGNYVSTRIWRIN